MAMRASGSNSTIDLYNYGKNPTPLDATHETVSTSPSSKGWLDAIATRRGRKALKENEIGLDAPYTHEQVVSAGIKRILRRSGLTALVAAGAVGIAHGAGSTAEQGVGVQERGPVPGMTVATPNGPVTTPENTPPAVPTAAKNIADH